MARHRTSRSPSPAGSRGSRHDDRRDRDRDRRREGPRDRRRSRSPGRYRDHYDRDRDSYRRRDRSIDRRDREDDYYRGSRRDGGSHRDRRRSRDRDRSPPRRRDRSRNKDTRPRRDDSTARSRREGTVDSTASRKRTEDARPRNQGLPAKPDPKDAEVGETGYLDMQLLRYANSFAQAAKSAQTQAQTPSDKQAERLAKLEAWKKKTLTSKQATKDTDATSTRKLLAEMDGRTSGTPPAAASPLQNSSALVSSSTPQSANQDSPVVPYAGKFDPKAIAKKAAARHHSPAALGSIPGAPTIPGKSVQSTVSKREYTLLFALYPIYPVYCRI